MNSRYVRQVVLYAVTAVISVLLVLYILYHLFGGYETKLETLAASYITMEDTLTVDAYIMRNETVLYSSNTGSINYLCSDGTRVKVGQNVAAVYDGGSIQSRLMELDNEIAVLEKSNLGETFVIADTKTIDSQIDSMYKLILERLYHGKLSDALSKKEDLLVSLNKRQIVVKNVENYDERIASLKAERTELVNSISDISEYVSTSVSGYFYSTLDGYEATFNSSKISTMQMEDYDIMISSAPALSGYSSSDGYAVGKIDTDFEWYLVCELTKEQYRAIAGEKRTFSVVFPSSNDERIDLTLYRVVNPAEDERVLLILSCGYMPDGFNYLRRQSVEIVITSYNGYKVPVSAVRLVDGVQGVYVLDSSTVLFKRIVPLFEKDGYFVCEERDTKDETQDDRLSLHDFIITKGKNLSDGKMVS